MTREEYIEFNWLQETACDRRYLQHVIDRAEAEFADKASDEFDEYVRACAEGRSLCVPCSDPDLPF